MTSLSSGRLNARNSKPSPDTPSDDAEAPSRINFAIDPQTCNGFKIWCVEHDTTMTDELTRHIQSLLGNVDEAADQKGSVSEYPDDLVPTTVLYDVMREAANRLGGKILQLLDQHPDEEYRYLVLHRKVRERVKLVNPLDREAIRVADSNFRAELNNLPDM